MSVALDYPYPEIDRQGGVREVAPGILWVRMPLPFALNHINLWLIEDGDGWAMVDTGLGVDEVRDLWERVFAAHLGGRPVRRVFVTHFHPDHLGQAGWLEGRFGASLNMTQQEWLMGRLLHIDSTEETIANTAEFYRRAAVEPEYIRELEDRGGSYAGMVTTIPRRFNRLEDDERVSIGGREWRVITGQGHAPEHMCLYCPDLRVLFTGDHILPRITPIIGVQPLQPDENPLANYLRSFAKFDGLPDDVLVLPAHNLPFRGLHTRLAHMRRHHRERLEELYDAASQPITARQGVDVLFSYRKLASQDIRLATMETLSHAHYLMFEGRFRRTSRPDGVWEFKRA